VTLSPKHLAAAALCARNYSGSQVAALVGCGRRSVVTWLQDPDFRAAVERARQDLPSERELRPEALIMLGRLTHDKGLKGLPSAPEETT
jgi:hypothetical protein